MKTIWLCFFAFAALAPGQKLPSMFEDRRLDSAVIRLKTDDRITYLQKVVAAKPDSLHAKVLLAGANVQKMRETTDFGYIERASKLLDSVLTTDAKNYEARRLRTEIQLEYHQFSKAAASSRELIGMNASDPWNWGTLGDALIEMGDYDQGADSFQKMMDLRPDLSSYNRAAHYRFLTNDAKGAVEVMQHAVSAGSSSPENVAWCLVELGHIYFKTDQLLAAENSYRKALMYFPGSHAAHAGVGRVQAAQGNLDDAINSYTKARTATPMPDYAAALGDLYEAKGLKKEAAQQAQFVDAIYQLMRANKEKANRNLSLIYSDHNRNLGAALELAEAELDVRKDIYTYDALAWALYKHKRYDEAEAASIKARKLETPEPAFYYHAGMIAAARNKTEEARANLQKALALNPKFDFVQARLAAEKLQELSKPQAKR